MSKKKQIILKSIIYLIVCILFFAFISLPQIQRICLLSAQISEKKTRLSSLIQKKENLKDLKSKEDKINVTLISLSDFLIKKEEALNFVIKLEEIAAKTGISQTLNIENEEKIKEKAKEENAYESLSSLNAQLFIEGEFKNIIAFILFLENLKNYTDINSLNITNQAAEGPGKLVKESTPEEKTKASLKLKIFTQE